MRNEVDAVARMWRAREQVSFERPLARPPIRVWAIFSIQPICSSSARSAAPGANFGRG